MEGTKAETTFFRSQTLPQERLEGQFARTYLAGKVKQCVLNYGRMALDEDIVPVAVGGPSRLLLFAGEPGTGKTTLATGLANELAKSSQRKLLLLSVKADEFLSELEGRTPKLIREAFRWVGVLAQGRDVVLRIDEVESLGYSRQRLTRTGDPSDLTRATNIVLQELDEMPPRVLVVGTTNLLEVVDQALVSRADLVVRFALPSEELRTAILADSFARYAGGGLALGGDDAAALAHVSEGLSGRALRKSIWIARMITGKPWKEVQRDDVVRALAMLQEADGSGERQRKGTDHGGDTTAHGSGSLQARGRGRGSATGNGRGRGEALALLG